MNRCPHCDAGEIITVSIYNSLHYCTGCRLWHHRAITDLPTEADSCTYIASQEKNACRCMQMGPMKMHANQEKHHEGDSI